jgi:hypothetical protein
MNCLHCNKPIEGKRNTKKYCSNTCKQYAYINRSFNQSVNYNAVSKKMERNSAQIKFKKNDLDVSDSSNPEKNAEITKNTFSNSTNTILKSGTHEYIKTEHQEKENFKSQEHQYIDSDILEKIQQGQTSLKTANNYFTNNSEVHYDFVPHQG